jgi:hypothetical protein
MGRRRQITAEPEFLLGNMVHSIQATSQQHGTNNTFIGPYGLWGISYQPMTAPVINWCWDGGQQQNCVAAAYVNNNTQVNLGCGAPPQGATNYVCPQDQPANGLGNLFYSTRASAALHNWPSSALPLGSMPSVDNGAVVGWPLDRTNSRSPPPAPNRSATSHRRDRNAEPR